MQIISRRDAKAAGLNTYFTGQECKRGHLQLRYVGNGRCLLCNKEDYANADPQYQKDYAKKHAEKKREMAKLWNDAHPSRVLARVNKWASENRDKVAENQRRWRERNPELAQARIKDWEQRNPERKKGYSHARRARQMSVTSDVITDADLSLIRHKQNDACPYCCSSLFGKGELDHITPIASGGSHSIDNVQYTCRSCNRRKSKKTDAEYREYMLKVANADQQPERRRRRKTTEAANID